MISFITFPIASKQYISLLPSTLNLQEGKQRELEITFVAAEDILMNKVSGDEDFPIRHDQFHHLSNR